MARRELRASGRRLTLFIASVSVGVAAIVAVGVGIGFAYVPSVGVLQRWFVRGRGLATGLAVAGIGVGTLIAPPISRWMVASMGWRESFQVLSAVVLGLGLAAAWMLYPDGAPAGWQAQAWQAHGEWRAGTEALAAGPGLLPAGYDPSLRNGYLPDLSASRLRLVHLAERSIAENDEVSLKKATNTNGVKVNEAHAEDEFDPHGNGEPVPLVPRRETNGIHVTMIANHGESNGHAASASKVEDV